MAHVFLCRAHSSREPGFHIPSRESLNEWFLSEEFCRGATSVLKGSKHSVEILPATLGMRIACIRNHYRKDPDGGAVAIEMHCNEMPGKPLQRGFFCMAWYKSAAAIEMAQEINREIRKLRPSAKCRGINKVSHTHRWVGTGMEYKDGPLGFLENIPCPSVILEAGYLSNPMDAAWLRGRENRFALGQAVGSGILTFLEE